MKKHLINSLILTLTVFSSQAVLSDIKVINKQAHPSQLQAAVHTQNSPSWLGIWIADIPMSLASHIAPLLKNNQGVIIRNVSPNSPAQTAGLKIYDVITGFNDQEIYSQKQLTALVRGTAPDTKIKLDIIHQGKAVTKEVELKASPKSMQANHESRQKPWPPAFQPFSQPGGHPRSHASRGMLPPPGWLNDPFFRQGFKHPFPSRDIPENQAIPPADQSQSWSKSQFESIEITAAGDDKIRAAVKYKDSNGNSKEFVFEGSQNEIRKQIMGQKEMDNNRKKHLLQALDMNNTPPAIPDFDPFMTPDWFNQPPPHQWFHNMR